MAEVTVFVDDAVRGRLPDICIKDGVPASGRLRVTQEVGRSNRLGILWLLLLAGPLGWIGLLLLLPSRSSGEELAVDLPYSDAAYERFVQARRLRTIGAVVAPVGGATMLLLTAWARLQLTGSLLTIGVILAGIIVAMVGDFRLGRASVGVRLDASRRWVTLRGAHPAFVSAYAEQEQAERPHSRV